MARCRDDGEEGDLNLLGVRVRGLSPTEIRSAEETGLQRNDKCVQFGCIKCAVSIGQSGQPFCSSEERLSQMTQIEFTSV